MFQKQEKNKLIIKHIIGKDLYIREQLKCNVEFHGNSYGGWSICPDRLTKGSIVYSLGVGRDITFDLSLIKKYDVTVFAFDPTPQSIDWIKEQKLPNKFNFSPYGISGCNGTAKLYPPHNVTHVSHSIFDRGSERKHIEVEVRKFSTIVKEFGHEKIDLCKMDIEGSEYEVIADIIQSKITISQILVE